MKVESAYVHRHSFDIEKTALKQFCQLLYQCSIESGSKTKQSFQSIIYFNEEHQHAEIQNFRKELYSKHLKKRIHFLILKENFFSSYSGVYFFSYGNF